MYYDGYLESATNLISRLKSKRFWNAQFSPRTSKGKRRITSSYLWVIATAISAIAAIWAALEYVNVIERIEHEIYFLNSWHVNEQLLLVGDYSRRFAKYGVDLNSNPIPATQVGRISGLDWAHSVTLRRLRTLRAEKRNLVSRLVKTAAIAAVLAPILFELGL